MAPAGTVFTQLKPMPIPRTSSAPLFDGKYVNDFLSIIERHGEAAQLPDTDWPKYIIQYCTDEVKQVIRFCEELEGKDWDKAKQLLKELYGSNDEPIKATVDTLRIFVKEHARGKDFASRAEVDEYHRGYLTIAAQLKSKKLIDATEMKLKFFAGLPRRTREFVTARLPATNLATSSPPDIKTVIDIICRQFNPNSIESYNVDSDHEDSDDETAVPQPLRTTTMPLSSILDATKTKMSTSKPSDIDMLAQQLQQLSISQAQMQQALQNAMSSGSFSRPQTPYNSTEKTCFICGQTGTHRLHPRHCPETSKLIAESIIKFDVARNRYVLLDGSDLPQLPFGAGGVAQYLREHKHELPRPEREIPPHMITAKASPATLMMGDLRALSGDVYAIASNQDEFYFHDSYPVTRTGKDTAPRSDPMRRPPARKPAERPPTPTAPLPPAIPAKPSPSTTPHIPNEARVPGTTDTAPPPAINRRDGWKDSLPRASKDIEMKDDTKGKTPQYHYTSEVQDKVSVDSIQDMILGTQVTLTLKDILGISPSLQKRMTEATKIRREYVTKSGEYDLYSAEAEQELARTSAGARIDSASSIYLNDLHDPSMLDSFILRYSNAVNFRPTKKYAITTGIFTAELAGHTIRFMVDCGSELNIFPERLLAQTSLALDYEGTRWSLKGVNGGPVGLRGVCKDVPISIGGHRFDHHFFVTRDDMDSQDCILGQPWIQWFAARIDYTRSGLMKIMLWKDGDRGNNPTVSMQLTRPNDPRNVDATGPLPGPSRPPQEESESAHYRHMQSHHQRAYIEEVEDEYYDPDAHLFQSRAR